MIGNMLLNMICSFGGTIAFSVLYNVPMRYYGWCGTTGMVGWMVYYFLKMDIRVGFAAFIATLVIVLISRVLAVYQKCPITIFLVSGVFPIIPGASIYYTVYYIVNDKLSMAADMGMVALEIAFAIVLGIAFMVSVPKRWFVWEYIKHGRNEVIKNKYIDKKN